MLGATVDLQLIPDRSEAAIVRPGPPSAETSERPHAWERRFSVPSGAVFAGVRVPADLHWSASGTRMGKPIIINTQQAWWVSPGPSSLITTNYDAQNVYQLAMIVTVLSVACCLWIVTRRRPW